MSEAVPPPAPLPEAPAAPLSAPSRRASFGYWLRENARQILSALGAVLIIRVYVVGILKIPPGSMATTLYGAHARVACPRCGWVDPVSASTVAERAANETGSVRAPPTS